MAKYASVPTEGYTEAASSSSRELLSFYGSFLVQKSSLRQKRDDCEAILRIGRFPSPRFVGQPELSPPPQKRRNGFPSKAAALKVPLHTARTVNDAVFFTHASCSAVAKLAQDLWYRKREGGGRRRRARRELVKFSGRNLFN